MEKKYFKWNIFVATLGALMFGINMAIISGAVEMIQEYFSLTDMELGYATGTTIIGCMIGAFTAGKFSDSYGRRVALIFAAILFLVNAFMTAYPTSLIMFALGRLIGGIAVGTVSVVIPTYIAEIAPAESRGTYGTFNQLAIVIGIFLAYVADYYLIDLGDMSWQYMFAVQIVPSLLFLVLLFVKFYESPKWLLTKGKHEEAKAVLITLMGQTQANTEWADYANSSSNDDKEEGKFSDLFKGNMRKVAFLGIMLAAFQQVTGINAVIVYAPSIFKASGFGGDSALLQSIMVGTVNLVFTLVAVWLIDKLGRKKLLLWGAGGMTISLGTLVYSFFSGNTDGVVVLVSLLSYIAFFAASLAPVMWVVCSEIYPNKIRGIAMSVSTAISWVCTYLVVTFFPWMLSSMGGTVAFGIFLIASILAFIFIQIYIPETKGKKLEEIEEELGLRKRQAVEA